MDKLKRIEGCLLAGACGDALGAPVEFKGHAQIVEEFGEGGIRDLVPAYGKLGAFTDDTQMTLFTAEGLIRAHNRARLNGFNRFDTLDMVYGAYLRWFATQRGSASPKASYDGWLFSLPELHSNRAPGGTCLGSLSSGECGTLDYPLNDSKGCGGVMRAAPAGILGYAWDGPSGAFYLGAESAAITHSHPCGYLSAGVLAVMVGALLEGKSLEESLEEALAELREYDHHQETLEITERAIELAGEGDPTWEKLESLGGAWVGEEALALSVYAALAYPDSLEEAMVFSVNHTGDADSTGAITGNLMGALYGVEAIPNRWLEPLELKSEITELSHDLYQHLSNETPVNSERDLEKYPAHP